MSSLLPVAVYGLEVPSGDVLIPAVSDFPATFRITMAAIDPSVEPALEEPGSGNPSPRATLKIIRQPPSSNDSSDDDDESDADSDDIMTLLNGADDDESESSDEDEERNGGPSDPSKSKKALKEKALAELRKTLDDVNDSDDGADTHVTNGVNGAASKKAKGKAKATGDEEESDDEGDGIEMEEFVLCTLDPVKHYQQPLDITVGEDEQVFFKVSGTYTVFLTGNYVVPADGPSGRMGNPYDEYDDDDYDLSPDEDELDDDEESDELDGLEDPRITEVRSDDEGSPMLVEKGEGPNSKLPKTNDAEKGKKSKKKRAADEEADEPANLDDMMAKSLKPADSGNTEEPKLSKKQMKKLKNNAGQAVPSAPQETTAKAAEKARNGVNSGTKADKKVQFAKNLESGPTGGAEKSNPDVKGETGGANPAKATLGPKTIQGVLIDDKRLGTGPAAKKGDTVTMRYIGKLQSNNLQFDANKSGTPFKFKLGAGEVIKGWDIGVAGMSVRGERRIVIPPHLGYGKKAMDKIPPNSTLVFEVKLLSIN